jgi:hypothetical protein
MERTLSSDLFFEEKAVNTQASMPLRVLANLMCGSAAFPAATNWLAWIRVCWLTPVSAKLNATKS